MILLLLFLVSFRELVDAVVLECIALNVIGIMKIVRGDHVVVATECLL